MYMIYHIYENHEDFEICYNIEIVHDKVRISEIHNLLKILYNGYPLDTMMRFSDVVEFGARIDFKTPEQ